MMRKLGKSSMPRVRGNCAQAFTFTELAAIVSVVVVLTLVGIPAANWIGYKSKEKSCLANLRQLGMAMSSYETSNDGRLPFAFIEYNESKFVSWDRLIYSYGSFGANQKGLLRCPSDTIPANGAAPRRTYAMPKHSMDQWNWPPAPGNATGVGLWWSPRGRWHAALASVNSSNSVPSMRADLISAPAMTALLTEQAQRYNVEFSYAGAAIDGPASHLDAKILTASQYHGGKFNYLMVDGHVRLLSPLESLGESDPMFDDPTAQFENVWTIKHH